MRGRSAPSQTDHYLKMEIKIMKKYRVDTPYTSATYTRATLKEDASGLSVTGFDSDGEHGSYFYPKGEYTRWVELPVTYVVAIYETDRAFGGPEEGGWYYQCGVPSDEPELLALMRVFSDYEEAVAYYTELDEKEEEMNEEWGRRPPWSVACNGWLTVHLTEGMPKAYPEEIPTYE